MPPASLCLVSIILHADPSLRKMMETMPSSEKYSFSHEYRRRSWLKNRLKQEVHRAGLVPRKTSDCKQRYSSAHVFHGEISIPFHFPQEG
jgi:hypothetical protein